MRLTRGDEDDTPKIEEKHCERSWQRFKTREKTYWGATLLQYLSMPFLKYSTASHLTFTSSMWLLKMLCGGKTEKKNNRYALSWCLTQLIAGKLKPHSTCPVCCINTYPTSSLPSALNYDTIIISLVLVFTCCTNSCSKDKNNLIKSLDVSRGKKSLNIFCPICAHTGLKRKSPFEDELKHTLGLW